MINKNIIVKEGNQVLKQKAAEVTIPVSKQDHDTLMSLLEYVMQSQNDEYAKKHNLRPGVGLACPQIGVSKRMFAVYATDEAGESLLLPIMNPKILNRSKELTYLPGGEGCLSVDRDTDGITLRHKKITVSGYVYNFNKKKYETKKITLEGYFAIVFQHEFDHLDGILFVDKLTSLSEAQNQGIQPLWEIDESFID